MPMPDDTGLLIMEVIEGLDAIVRPSTLPILFEYDGYEPAVCKDVLHIDVQDPQLSLDVENHELRTVVLCEQGPVGPPGKTGDVIVEVDTALVLSGRLVYESANDQVSHTDSRTLLPSLALGAFAGVNGRVTALGRVPNVWFTDVSPVPIVGQKVFLAAADDEPLDGAAGKVTALVPASGFLATVGTVLSVPVDFLTARRASVMIRVLDIIKRNP